MLSQTIKKVLLLTFLTLAIERSFCQQLQHYIFFSRDREKIHDPAFYGNPGIDGAQITYPWSRLERQKDQYDFNMIEEDLEFLKSKGKKLFVQFQDVTFDSSLTVVPKYLLNDPKYHGGVAPQYFYPDKNSGPGIGGWVSRRWDPNVAVRYQKILIELGKKFDGRIAGINVAETAIDVAVEGKPHPSGFSERTYVKALKKNMQVMRKAFRHSTPILYANFMPGNSLKNLKKLYRYAKKINMGMGGPDIKVYRPAQMNNSYPLIRALHGFAPTGVAVQEGNYSIINPKTGKKVTVPQILDFAKNYLRLNYIFWCTEQPYYTDEVLPMLRNIASTSKTI